MATVDEIVARFKEIQRQYNYCIEMAYRPHGSGDPPRLPAKGGGNHSEIEVHRPDYKSMADLIDNHCKRLEWIVEKHMRDLERELRKIR